VKVTLERLPESRVSLDIEVEQERVEQSLDVAYKRLAPGVRVPGFRPGKAPRPMVERHIGRQRLMSEALDDLVPKVYNEAIQTEDVDAIAQPELDSVELEPVRLKFTVPIRPTVDGGDYRAVRVEKEPIEVTAEMVDEQVQMLRRRYAVQAPVDRAIQWGDIIIADVTGEAEGEQFLEDENAEFPLEEGHTLLVEGLAEAFVGMKKGEEKTVELDLPRTSAPSRLRARRRLSSSRSAR
jgi:trigger factor